jgi:hypothetical protein
MYGRLVALRKSPIVLKAADCIIIPQKNGDNRPGIINNCERGPDLQYNNHLRKVWDRAQNKHTHAHTHTHTTVRVWRGGLNPPEE